MNDINAACAAASVVAPAPENSKPSVETRLRTLADLKNKGLIDSAEYTKRRSDILGSI
jgi:hypothetical protein